MRRRKLRDPIEQTRERLLHSFAVAFRTGRPVALDDDLFRISLERILTHGLTVFNNLQVTDEQRLQLYKLYHDELRGICLTPKNIPLKEDRLAMCMVDYIVDRC